MVKPRKSKAKPPRCIVIAGPKLDRLAAARLDFSFETTLSGLVHAERLERLKASGYRIDMIFLRLHSPEFALRRVAERVKQGGHSVPKADILRRFARGLRNFDQVYRQIADSWTIYDNSGITPLLVESGP